MQLFALTVLMVFVRLASRTSATPLPDCYALNKENYLYDFTKQIGKELELEGKDSDFVLRFCLDAQHRSNAGYVNFGRYSSQSMLKVQMDNFDFFQEYIYGDLLHCEHIGNSLTGRKAEVQIICGLCPNGASCKDDFGCICNVTYTHNLCKAKVVAAVNCSEPLSHIFPELSIGLQPKGSEVVKNGIVQRQYRKSFHSYSFESSQSSLSLYLTTKVRIWGNFDLHVQVQPSQGLLVNAESRSLSNTSATEMEFLLQIDWRCEMTRENPYEVNITISFEGYDPISFLLLKQCRTIDTQKEAKAFSFKSLNTVTLIGIFIGILLFGIKCKYKNKKQGGQDTENLWPLMQGSTNHVNGEDSIEPVVAVEVPLV